MFLLLLNLAEAAPVQVFGGVRNSMTTAGDLDGPRVGGRYVFGPAAVEANFFMNPRSNRYSSLDHVLVQLMGSQDFVMPVDNDLFAAQVLIDMGFIPLGDEDWSGGPHLIAGLEIARVKHTFYLSPGIGDEPYTGVVTQAPTLEISPIGGVVTGASVDVWWRSRVGLRLTWCARTSFEQEPDYDPSNPSNVREIVFNPTTALDVVVQL